MRVCGLGVTASILSAFDLAVSRLAAAESIFTLVDQLWENDAVERMVYLTAKRDHDVAEIELTRPRLLLMRREAEIEQYEVTCSIVDSAEPSTDLPQCHQLNGRSYATTAACGPPHGHLQCRRGLDGRGARPAYALFPCRSLCGSRPVPWLPC